MQWTLIAIWSIAPLRSAEPSWAQGQARDNVVIVLDASGSMGETMSGSRNSKMDEAKRALSKVVQTIPATTHVGMLIFSSRNLRNDLAYPLGPVDLPKLEQAIQSPIPQGGTPLGAYLKKGADMLLRQREAQHGYGTFRLLVVTDGEATDPELVNAHLPDILSRGIVVDVIGVDMKSDHALATRVHSYRRANDPEALVKGLSEVLAEIGGTQDDTASADALASIESIPDEVGKAMLEALVRSTAGNQPIGEKAPPRPAPAVASSRPAPAAPGLPGPASPAPQVPPEKGGAVGFVSVFCILFFGFFLLMIWMLVKKVQQRG